MKEKIKADHIVEGLDRCQTVEMLINDLLVDHPAIVRAGERENMEAAARLISQAWKNIGELEAP